MGSYKALNTVIALIFPIKSNAKWINPPFFFQSPTELIAPKAKQAILEYTNVYENPQNRSYTIKYNWDNDLKTVSYKQIESTYTISKDDNENITYWKQEYTANYKPAVIEYSYKYDNENRITDKLTTNTSQHIFYTGEKADSIVFWQYDDILNIWLKTQKSDFTYFNGGYDCITYIYDNETNKYNYKLTTRYSTDSQGRVISYKDLDSSSGQEHKFIFYENGYEHLISGYGAKHTSFKYKYKYNDKGDLIEYVYSEWINESYWNPCISMKYKYDYLDSGINELSTEAPFLIQEDILTVTAENCRIRIITPTGNTLIDRIINSNFSIKLNHGIYIIAISNKTWKIKI